MNSKASKMLTLVSLFVVFSFFVVTSSIAQEYTSIEIWPTNPGVFVSIGEQQFTAYGVTDSGQRDNITDLVDWWFTEKPFPGQTMLPDEIATIDGTGKVTIKDDVTWGRLLVNACYPKGCGPSPTGKISGIMKILLAPEYRVVSKNIGGAGTVEPIGDTTDEGGGNYSLSVKSGRTASYNLTMGDTSSGFYIDGSVPCDDTALAACPEGTFDSNHTQYSTGRISGDCCVNFNSAAKLTVTSGTLPSNDASDNGSISPAGPKDVFYNDPVQYTFTPGTSDYEADTVTDTCSAPNPPPVFTRGGTSYTTDPITQDCSVDVTFDLKKVVSYGLHPTDDRFGTITSTDPSGTSPVPVSYGNTFTLYLSPDDDTYEASSVIDTPTSCAGGGFNADHSQYQTGPITTDCSLEVHFTKKPKLTLNAESVSVNPLTGHGRVYTTTIPADEGCDSTGTGFYYPACPAEYYFAKGTVVTLNHDEQVDGTTTGIWVGWSGEVSPADDDCDDGQVTMNGDLSCVGKFDEVTP